MAASSPITAHPHLSVVPGKRRPSLIEPLTRREAEVLEQLGLAHSNTEIAGYLQISVRTVESHLSAIYGKLGVQGRLEALRYLHETRLPGGTYTAATDAAGV